MRLAISGMMSDATEAPPLSQISVSSASSASFNAKRAHLIDSVMTRSRSTSTPRSSENVCTASSQTHMASSTMRLAFARTALRPSPAALPAVLSDSSLTRGHS